MLEPQAVLVVLDHHLQFQVGQPRGQANYQAVCIILPVAAAVAATLATQARVV
jgi:hypothetical protein